MGSELVVTLPLAHGRRDVESLERSREERHRPRRVLIVEDNIDAAESLRRALELRGHVVRVVHDGRAALTTVQEVDPEVVLLDIGLPHMDGYEVARRLRATERGRQLFLVAVTGWGQPEDRARAQSAGFDEHLTKPVHSGELSDLIAAGPSDTRE
jgi:two-component system, chemotaxis family, CheB/CheR fusion protein